MKARDFIDWFRLHSRVLGQSSDQDLFLQLIDKDGNIGTLKVYGVQGTVNGIALKFKEIE